LKESEAHIVFGGQVDKDDNYVAPTILLEPELKHKVMQEEIFGPILSVYSYTVRFLVISGNFIHRNFITQTGYRRSY